VPRIRADLTRLIALHQAAAAAMEAELKNAAEEEFTAQRTSVTWRWGADRVTTNIAHAGATITDKEALFDWLEKNTAAVTKRTIREVPASYLESFLGVLAINLDTEDAEEVERSGKPGEQFTVFDPSSGGIVPGVRWITGGSLKSISLVISDAAKRAARSAVQAYVQGDAPFPS
jgi:hypothetical protein